jgi:DNA-binding Xre family transcriptional regulator
MLQFNLKAIMSEQKKTITWLSDKTGISRKTLSQMVNNDTKGIQFSTLEAVMSALSVEIDDLIVRAPISAILSVLADDEAGRSKKIPSMLKIDSKESFSTLMGLELIQLSGGDVDVNDFKDCVAFLSVGATVTSRGGLMVWIEPAVISGTNKLLMKDDVDNIINFLSICSDETQSEVASNVISSLLRRVERGGGDISKLSIDDSAAVFWKTSSDDKKILTVVHGDTYLPPEEHVIFKLNPDKEVSIVNGPLDSLKKR